MESSKLLKLTGENFLRYVFALAIRLLAGTAAVAIRLFTGTAAVAITLLNIVAGGSGDSATSVDIT